MREQLGEISASYHTEGCKLALFIEQFKPSHRQFDPCSCQQSNFDQFSSLNLYFIYN